jgi:hypothetical protein
MGLAFGTIYVKFLLKQGINRTVQGKRKSWWTANTETPVKIKALWTL